MAFNSGFDYQEAISILQLCMQLNGTGRSDVSLPDVSSGWTLSFDSREDDPGMQEENKDGKITGIGPFDNAWQLWKTKSSNRYAIVIRGTIDTAKSILDDVLGTAIYANCQLPVQAEGQTKTLPVQTIWKGDPRKASIHLGFAWGANILMYHNTKGILKELAKVPEGSDIYITGHSQGAAIATLIHSLLYHGSNDSDTALGNALAPKQFAYKAYFFAQPKPGNWQYGHGFAQASGNDGMSYCINNDRDWVPQVPFAFDLPDEMTNNPVDDYLTDKHPLLSKVVKSIESMARWSREEVGDVVAMAAKDAETYLGANIDAGYLSASPYVDNSSPCLNYVQCGNLISLRGEQSKEETSDEFWQHHCGTYLKLMEKELQ